MQTYKHTNIQTYRHTNIQTYKHSNIQTYKLTNKQKKTVVKAGFYPFSHFLFPLLLIKFEIFVKFEKSIKCMFYLIFSKICLHIFQHNERLLFLLIHLSFELYVLNKSIKIRPGQKIPILGKKKERSDN